MPRAPRNLQPGFCYHVTVRCNNREFRLSDRACREVLLDAIKMGLEKYGFKLYALCIMSNHVHYLLEPARPEDLPKIMHWLNWYTAMCFNRILHRSGHFWEKRYHSSCFPVTDRQHALNTLRYIHANPRAAGVRQGYFYDFSNYGSYDQLTDDGLTQWHPAFLELGSTLDECAARYRRFCKAYHPPAKEKATNTHWGSKLLAGRSPQARRDGQRDPAGQLPLGIAVSGSPERCQVSTSLQEPSVAQTFIMANRSARWAAFT